MFSSLYLIPPFPLGTIHWHKLIIFQFLKTASSWLSAKRVWNHLVTLRVSFLCSLTSLNPLLTSLKLWPVMTSLQFLYLTFWKRDFINPFFFFFFKHFPLGFGDVRIFILLVTDISFQFRTPLAHNFTVNGSQASLSWPNSFGSVAQWNLMAERTGWSSSWSYYDKKTRERATVGSHSPGDQESSH